MDHCNQCGRDFESDSAGTYTDDYGFVCNECRERMHFCSCCICGREFPIDQMVEWDGDLFCKSDYNSAKDKEKKEEKTEVNENEGKVLIKDNESSNKEELDRATDEIEKELDSLSKKENKENEEEPETEGPEED